MRMSNSGIIVVLLVVAVLAISGCIGGGGGGGAATPTPTAKPGSSITPAPTQTTTGPLGSLFNLGSLKMYEYRITTLSSGQTSVMTYKIEYSDSTYQGAPAKLTKMTYTMPGSSQMIISMYYSKTDDHLLGGTYSMDAGGQKIEVPIEADQGASYSENDWAASSRDSFEDMSGWTNAGTETLTANGKSYTCTKYTWSYSGHSYSVCTNAQAPMPMKYDWVDNQGNSWKMELLNWN